MLADFYRRHLEKSILINSLVESFATEVPLDTNSNKVLSLLETTIAALLKDLATRPYLPPVSNVYPYSFTGGTSIDLVITAINDDIIDNKTFVIIIISLRGLRRSKGVGIVTASLHS